MRKPKRSRASKSSKTTQPSRKRVLIVLILILVLVGAFLYVTNPDIREKFYSWIGINQPDSVQQKSESNTISGKSKQRKKSTNKNIPKAIKPDRYAHLDKYARETPDKYAHDKVELAKYLKKPAKNGAEKARLIYTWIATHIQYDDEAFNAGKENDESAKSVLTRRTALCDGFTNLFLELGQQMNLQVEKISGHAKGYGFKTGEKFSSIDHSWNAVKIGNHWQLIDVTWGSSYGETTTDKGLKSTMKFDPYWFSVKPEAFIFSHLPQNNSWQLTSQPITLKQYENLPSLKESFFKMGFDSRKVLQLAISGTGKEFVDTYHLDYPVNGAELPITKKIERGKEYTFSIESEYLESVMLDDGGQRIELKKEGNSYKIKYTPRGEKLQIAVKVNSFDTKFSVIVVYDIVDKKDLTAHNKMFLPFYYWFDIYNFSNITS